MVQVIGIGDFNLRSKVGALLCALIASAAVVSGCADDAECGDGTTLVDGVCNADRAFTVEPKVSSVKLIDARVASAPPFQVLHEISISASLEFAGEPFSTEVAVALIGDDGGGCLVGAVPVEHAPDINSEDGNFSSAIFLQSFYIPTECADLAGKNPELALYFDPFGNLQIEGRDDIEFPDVNADPAAFLAAAAPSRLSLEDCDACQDGIETLDLEANPGPGVNFVGLELGTALVRIERPRSSYPAVSLEEAERIRELRRRDLRCQASDTCFCETDAIVCSEPCAADDAACVSNCGDGEIDCGDYCGDADFGCVVCQADEVDCGDYCAPVDEGCDVTCGQDEVDCGDGTCAFTIEECDGSGCPPDEVDCGDGTCAFTIEDCDGSGCLPDELDCGDGTCAIDEESCPICLPGDFECTDGSCAQNIEDCPGSLCEPTEFECSDQTCAAVSEDCLGSCAVGEFNCNDGTCATEPGFCNIGCQTGESSCANGSCAANQTDCQLLDTCEDIDFICSDSTCAEFSIDCKFTCAPGEFNCLTPGCAATQEECGDEGCPIGTQFCNGECIGEEDFCDEGCPIGTQLCNGECIGEEDFCDEICPVGTQFCYGECIGEEDFCDPFLRPAGGGDPTAPPVAVADPGVEAKLSGTPAASLSFSYEVEGKEGGESIDDDGIEFRLSIRPVSGTRGTDNIDSDDFEWMEATILNAPEGAEANSSVSVDEPANADALEVITHYRAMNFPDATLEKLNFGSWSRVNDFELQLCLASEFVPTDGDDDGCISVFFFIIRDDVGPDGPYTPNDTDTFNANQRSEGNRWYREWRALGGGITPEAWWTTGGSRTGTGFGYAGGFLPSAGSWYESGARVTGYIFNSRFTIAEIFAQAYTEQSGGGQALVSAKIVGIHFLPALSERLQGGVALTLEDILDPIRQRRGKEYPVTFKASYPLAGRRFGIGPISATAKVGLFAVVGLDERNTELRLSTEPSIPPTCTNGEPRTADGSVCYRILSSGGTAINDWDRQCKALAPGASLAAAQSDDELRTMLRVMGAQYSIITNYTYIGRGARYWDDRARGQDSLHPLGETYLNGVNLFSFARNYPRGQVVVYDGGNWNAYPPSVRSYRALCRIPVQDEASPTAEKLSVTVVPSAAAGAVAEISAGPVGVRGMVTVIQAEFPVSGAAAFAPLPNGAYLKLSLEANGQLSMLSGGIEAFVTLSVGWASKTYTHTLIEWNGINLASFSLLPELEKTFRF